MYYPESRKVSVYSKYNGVNVEKVLHCVYMILISLDCVIEFYQLEVYNKYHSNNLVIVDVRCDSLYSNLSSLDCNVWYSFCSFSYGRLCYTAVAFFYDVIIIQKKVPVETESYLSRGRAKTFLALSAIFAFSRNNTL